MQYKETLLWILDKDAPAKPHRVSTDDEMQRNIEFVHSLGLKCDCVGWCRMDLDRPDIDGIFAKIRDFCQRESWGVRAWYKRTFTGGSDWFALKTAQFKENVSGGYFDVADRHGGKVRLERIKAYADLTPGPRDMPNFVAVPERFRDACQMHGIPCEFFWVEDKGKWHGAQYFGIVPTQTVPFAAVSGYRHRGENEDALVEKLGGMLPRVMELCYDVWDVDLPEVFRACDLPEGGIVCAYLPEGGRPLRPPTILIHRAAAELLVGEKALSWKDLIAVPVVEEFPAGYRVRETAPLHLPAESYIDAGMKQYESLKQNPRPVRQLTEKDALKLLRSAKKERKEDFTKALTRLESDSPLLPYWKITGSGYLSDEYELLSPDTAGARTAEFHAAMAAEELLAEKPTGIVFASCPDGDAVVLTPDGAVERWSHEGPEVLEQWPTLAQFFGDAIQS